VCLWQAEKKAKQREKEKERKRAAAEKKAKAAEGARAAAETEVATAAAEAAALAARYNTCLTMLFYVLSAQHMYWECVGQSTQSQMSTTQILLLNRSCLSVVCHEGRQARPVLCSKLVTALVVASCTGKSPICTASDIRTMYYSMHGTTFNWKCCTWSILTMMAGEPAYIMGTTA